MAGLFEGPFWDPDIYQLELVDPVIGGVPNIATMAGIDNIPHQQLARRTQWLKGQLGGFTGVSPVAVNTVLTAANTGELIYVSAPITLTLPAASAVPAGAALAIMPAVGGVVVQRAGADVIQGTATTAVASLTLGARNTLWLVSDGAGTWIAISGSAQLSGAANLAAGKSVNGYQILPSGLILQWLYNTQTVTAGATSAAVSYPQAFPNAVLSIVGIHAGNVEHVNVMVDGPTISNTSMRWKSTYTGTQGHYFWLIGH